MNAFCRDTFVDVDTLQLRKITNTLQLSVIHEPTALLGSRMGTEQRNNGMKCP